MKHLILIITIFQIFVVSHQIYFTNWVSYKEYNGHYWNDWTDWEYNITKIVIDSPLIRIGDSVYTIQNTEQKDGTIVYTTDKNQIRLRNKQQLYIDTPNKITCYSFE